MLYEYEIGCMQVVFSTTCSSNLYTTLLYANIRGREEENRFILFGIINSGLTRNIRDQQIYDALRFIVVPRPSVNTNRTNFDPKT